MHRNLFTKVFQYARICFGLQSDQNTNFAHAVSYGIVGITGHVALLHTQDCRATQSHILSDCRDKMRQLFLNRPAFARVSCRRKGCQIALILQKQIWKSFYKSLEFFIAGDEVCFWINFQNSANIAIDADGYKSFSSHTARLFSRSRKTFLAQPVLRSFHIAVRFVQRFFTIHHTRTRFLP